MTVEEWLIDAIKVRPIIWNTKDENYKNTKLKNEAYDEIARESNLSVVEIKRKWHSIRSAFSRELRMRNLYSNVTGTNNDKRVWKHFNKLTFLQDECLELDAQVDEEYTIAIVSDEQVDQSSSLVNQQNSVDNSRSPIQLAAANNSNHNEINNNTNHKKSTKKRKTVNQTTSTYSFCDLNKSSPLSNSFQMQLSEEDHFGHLIAASLRKFDPKKQETVKLKIQEVIVQYLAEED